MNFIDKAIAEKLSGDDFLQAMADILRKAKELPEDDEDRYEEEFEKLERQTALYNDYESFWDRVREYIDANLVREKLNIPFSKKL